MRLFIALRVSTIVCFSSSVKTYMNQNYLTYRLRFSIVDNVCGVLVFLENSVDVIAERSVVNQTTAIGDAVFGDQGLDIVLV